MSRKKMRDFLGISFGKKLFRYLASDVMKKQSGLAIKNHELAIRSWIGWI